MNWTIHASGLLIAWTDQPELADTALRALRGHYGAACFGLRVGGSGARDPHGRPLPGLRTPADTLLVGAYRATCTPGGEIYEGRHVTVRAAVWNGVPEVRGFRIALAGTRSAALALLGLRPVQAGWTAPC